MDKVSIAIVGSRTWIDKQRIMDIVKHWNPRLVRVVSGGAKGADTLGVECARRCGIEVVEILPDWDAYGKQAGMIRNGLIVEQSRIVYAFWDGESKGTLNTINRAMKAKHIKGVYVYKDGE